MPIPDFLRQYAQQAESLAVLDIEFSGPTYQIRIKDKKARQEGWVFVQLNDEGDLKDTFCFCQASQHQHACPHIAASYLAIFGKGLFPLHKRFEYSLWNLLCQRFALHYGMSTDVLRKGRGGKYTITSAHNQTVFTLITPTWAPQLIEDRLIENEANSIKFSNLSPEEIVSWRAGNPSMKLQYELSFWSDLAKRLFLADVQGEKYKIIFHGKKGLLPDLLEARFKEATISFSLSESDWPVLIPALAQVHSPLKVFGVVSPTDYRIHYDPKEAILSVESSTKIETFKAKEGIAVGKWLFSPERGFYPTEAAGNTLQRYLEAEIPSFFNDHLPILKTLASNVEIHEEVVPLSFELYFDEDKALHVRAFLFEKGDLWRGESRPFDGWVYIHGRGFFRIRPGVFEELKQTVPPQQVGHFITKYRSWLNTQPGFATHQNYLEGKLTYSLDEKHQLQFKAQAPTDAHQFEFGPWVYVEGEGFYQRGNPLASGLLKPDLTVPTEAISSFVKMNREELMQVPGFFSKSCPIERSGLRATIKDDGSILFQLIHQRASGYEDAPLDFFDDVVYMPGEGFHRLDIDPRLIEGYLYPVSINLKERDLFIAHQLRDLEPYILENVPELIKPHRIKLILEKLKSLKDRYHVQLLYESELGQVDVNELWDAYRQRRRFALTKAGLLDLTDARFIWLRTASDQLFKGGECSLSSLDMLRLNAFDPLTTFENPSVQRRLEEILSFTKPSEPELSGFKATLREYQKLGLDWLWTLYHHRLSALLCDDMGLGKTLQALALITAVKNTVSQESLKRRFLIVCPTSVIYHWQDKFQKFTPELKVFTFYGIQRNLSDFDETCDVMLTSFGIWRREKEILGPLPFELAIFDEVQLAKNESSKLHQSLLKVRARMRIGLTGTPIENRLKELKALFDIVLPTYMPPPVDYRHFFTIPIERDQNEERRVLLSRFIHPFVLRRKKGEVLTELPEKIEEIAYCSLLPDQCRMYQEVLQNSREAIMQRMKDSQEPVPYMHIFALLAKLKQICDHPAVYLKEPENYHKFHSGKWERFVELIEEARDSSQKVVVYSQYLAQLDIFIHYLRERNIRFATIRGATTDRGAEVRRFQEDPKCEVFVASLQAAGLGIDLTAASVVIHYDRWWNAARENQATDRVHRIGQNRGVEVFKLVTKGTFEERIHEMILRKGRLMEEVVEADDQRVLKKLDRAEILELLQDVHYGRDDQRELIIDE